MIVHIAIYKWKKNASKKEIHNALEIVRSLKDKVDGIVDIRCGENFSIWNEGYTHAFLVLTKDKDSLEKYRQHPLHQKIAEEIDSMDDGSIGIDFQD